MTRHGLQGVVQWYGAVRDVFFVREFMLLRVVYCCYSAGTDLRVGCKTDHYIRKKLLLAFLAGK